MNNQAPLFTPPWSQAYSWGRKFLQNIIVDRWSKYSVLIDVLDTSSDPQRAAKMFSHELNREKFFAKATHNSYAWRAERDDGFIGEWYFDDGEKWAGKIILRELQKTKLLGCIVVVTRYYGGVKLEWDRFRHVVDASQMIIAQISEHQ